MSNDETIPLDKMCNFFVWLKRLVHMAETAKSKPTLNEIEKEHYDSALNNLCLKNGEGRAFTLIRLACKSFARGADEKSGCHGPFVSFIDSVLNILCVNASCIYFFASANDTIFRFSSTQQVDINCLESFRRQYF